MRSITVIALFLIFLPAALAQNNSEDTRDLPSPSTDAPALTPAPPSDAKERTHAGRAPARAQCQAMWVCGRLRYPSNDAYAPGSYVNSHSGRRPFGSGTLPQREALLNAIH
jgi:hypothetical protein